jgi:flagellin-like protein
MPRTARGQSPVVGTVLLVAVVVVLAAVLSVLVLGYAEDLDAGPPSVRLDADVGQSDVTVRHAVGDTLRPANVEVIVAGPNSTIRYPLENLRGSATDRFRAGDAFSVPHGVSAGEVTVRLVHEPSNTVVGDLTHTLTDGVVSLAAFTDDVTANDYVTNQNDANSQTTVSDGGRTVTLTGSQWRYLDYSYDVTSRTMVTFEFKSTATGDIHGIGLEDEAQPQGQDSSRVVRIYGTQNWGINVSTSTAEPYYRQSDGWRRYTIPLGDLYGDRGNLGQAESIVFVMDCDATTAVASGTDSGKCKSRRGDVPTANSYFRNVEIYEKGEAS